MTEVELFDRIDDAIKNFKKNEGYQKRIKVSHKPHSDWLVFHYRRLEWTNNGLSYLIEISPNFDKDENILDWTMSSVVTYDSQQKRFYYKHVSAGNKHLQFITDNIEDLLHKSFQAVIRLSKKQIPFAVNLKR